MFKRKERLLKFLIFLIIFDQVVESDKYRYSKVTKIYFNSSGITTTRLSCYVKPLSPYNSVFGAKCDLLRALNNFFITVTLFHKPTTSTRFYQIYQLKNLEVCKLTKISKSKNKNMLKTWMEYSNVTLNGIIHECPYKVESIVTQS